MLYSELSISCRSLILPMPLLIVCELSPQVVAFKTKVVGGLWIPISCLCIWTRPRRCFLHDWSRGKLQGHTSCLQFCCNRKSTHWSLRKGRTIYWKWTRAWLLPKLWKVFRGSWVFEAHNSQEHGKLAEYNKEPCRSWVDSVRYDGNWFMGNCTKLLI